MESCGRPRGALLIGLGNPGPTYRATRHNVGFMVLDSVACRWGSFGPWREEPGFRLCVGGLAGWDVWLAEPLTFMNRSGGAVALLLDRSGFDRSRLVVVHDDLDLPFGSLRIRSGGGDGGHRGVRSVIAALGSGQFTRVKVGVGRPPPKRDVVEHVLSPFTEEESAELPAVLERGAEALVCTVVEGPEKAMNRFHT